VKRDKRKGPIKAVIDTNVLVSGLFAESGSIAEMMDLWIDERFELVTSEKILSELYRVLHKSTIQEHFKPSEEDIIEYLDTLREKATITPGLYQTDKLQKDPTDNMVLACGLEAKADYIVSGDKHLRNLKQFQGIKVVNVKEFVEKVRKKPAL
jgi:putative PIN family toxin of toxin-antitoxin system